MKRILFICTGNSARSIMAEAIANTAFGGDGRLQAFSAGSSPSGQVHPLTVETLRAHGHSVEGLHSKPLEQLLNERFDMVITVCERARQSCPLWPQETEVHHWDIEDPAAFEGTDDEKRAFFEKVYAEIEEHVKKLLTV